MQNVSSKRVHSGVVSIVSRIICLDTSVQSLIFLTDSQRWLSKLFTMRNKIGFSKRHQCLLQLHFDCKSRIQLQLCSQWLNTKKESWVSRTVSSSFTLIITSISSKEIHCNQLLEWKIQYKLDWVVLPANLHLLKY